MASILSLAAPIVIWMIEKFIMNEDEKTKAKKRYYDYVDYWKKNRVTPEKHGSDLKDIVEKDENR